MSQQNATVDSQLSTLELRDATGNVLGSIKIGTPDINGEPTGGGDLARSNGHAALFLDGIPYGSLHITLTNGRPSIALGQYDPTFDQWEGLSPLTTPELHEDHRGLRNIDEANQTLRDRIASLRPERVTTDPQTLTPDKLTASATQRPATARH